MMRKCGRFCYVTSAWLFFFFFQKRTVMCSEVRKSSLQFQSLIKILFTKTLRTCFLPSLTPYQELRQPLAFANGECHNPLYDHICVSRSIAEERTIRCLRPLSSSSKPPNTLFFSSLT